MSENANSERYIMIILHIRITTYYVYVNFNVQISFLLYDIVNMHASVWKSPGKQSQSRSFTI